MNYNESTCKVIGAAFGDPISYKTFSGYSRHLFLAMQKIDTLLGTISTRCIRIHDFLDGCANLAPLRHFKRSNLSAHWLWKAETVHKFSQRFQKRLALFDEKIPVLQVGTHVYPLNTNRAFYCVTDATISQAAEAGQFKIRDLTTAEVRIANEIQRRMFDSYRKIFVLCEWTRSSVINDYGQPSEKVIVIGAGANMLPLAPAANKYTSHKILFVGFDWVRKGGPLLLEAFRIVRGQIPDAMLNIIGCSPEISESGVNVIGRLNKNVASEKAKLERLYQEANCFCILPKFDPFPNVLLEAQVTSTPVVSLLNGSRTEAIRDGITGSLVANSPKDVAEAIVQILSSPQQARAMGIAAKEFILKQFTWSTVAEKVLASIFGKV